LLDDISLFNPLFIIIDGTHESFLPFILFIVKGKSDDTAIRILATEEHGQTRTKK
jgi:hypothetical protein